MMDSHLLVVSGGRVVQSSQRDEEESDAVGARLLTSSREPLQHCQTRRMLTPTIHKMKYSLKRPTIIDDNLQTMMNTHKQLHQVDPPFCGPHRLLQRTQYKDNPNMSLPLLRSNEIARVLYWMQATIERE